jgi:CheY-like chemotaxis protein
MQRMLAHRFWNYPGITCKPPIPAAVRLISPRHSGLDIGLPDFNGYELATKIRATPWGRGVVLIAVTGWGQEEDRRRALEAGFNHHLTKPIAPATVESLLQSLDPALRAAQ